MSRPAVVSCFALLLLLAACGSGGSTGDSQATSTVSATRATADDRAPAAGRTEPRPGPPPRGRAIGVVDSEFGRVVTDRRGEALYVFGREDRTRSECYGDCARAWPPVLTKGGPRALGGARQRLLGVTRRSNGKLQVTYAGRPLYYYVGDSPGQILCNDVEEFGGLWLVLEPSGHPYDA